MYYELLLGDMYANFSGNYESVVVSCECDKTEIHKTIRNVVNVLGFDLTSIILTKTGYISKSKIEVLKSCNINISEYTKIDYDEYFLYKDCIKNLVVDILNYVNPKLNLKITEFDMICIPYVGDKMY